MVTLLSRTIPLLSVLAVLVLRLRADEFHIPFPPARDTQPTQFEISLTETFLSVKHGESPDPAWRKADGTPGTILDALSPQHLNPEVNEYKRHMRKLQTRASQWRFFGANIPFSTGPTLAALNSSFYRYASVTPRSNIDWRTTNFITPIIAQYNCASCWAVAAADTVAMATAIAARTRAVAPGVQQICDCSGMQCCQGGWPEDAYSWLVSQGNITTSVHYNYWAMDGRNCSLRPNYPLSGLITGWERVPSHSTEELKKAVNMQPVLVYISAGSKDFREYTSGPPGSKNFNVYDGNCTTEVNHALVVVGYDTYKDPDGNMVDYWILKNSWPDWMAGPNLPGWGDRGYMYIRMSNGVGKCGMLSVSPLYPVNFPNAPNQATVQRGRNTPVLARKDFWWKWWKKSENSPCDGIINPCGGGKCWFNDTFPVARCECPFPYVELEGVPTSRCVHPSPCSLGLFNPCGSGTCTNVGDGSYFCTCSAGYMVGTLVSGAPTCVPFIPLGSSGTTTYITQSGDTCLAIQTAYGVAADTFARLNPFLACDSPFLQGLAVILPATSSSLCAQQYVLKPSDTCSRLGSFISSGSASTLLSTYSESTTLSTATRLSATDSATLESLVVSANPTISCSNLFKSQAVCVNKTVDTSVIPPVCGQTYATTSLDNCKTVQDQFKLSADFFLRLNPGVSCSPGVNFPEGLRLCISATPTVRIDCAQWYTVQQGDSCALIRNAAQLSQFQLLYINPGLQCQAPFLYVGQQICIDAPLPPALMDPNSLLYTVAGGDTWSYIQSTFSSRCMPNSISVPNIAAANANITISLSSTVVVTAANLSSTPNFFISRGFNISQANILDWPNFNLSYIIGKPLIIPCAPKIAASCGCVPSLTVCGTDGVTYNSYCDARCNFATPVTNGQCSFCQAACANRPGRVPSNTAVCPSGFVCPWPQWEPPLSDALSQFTVTPQCSYRVQTCTLICAQAIQDGVWPAPASGTSSTCYNYCMACSRVPCSGPSGTLPVDDPTCRSASTNCARTGCTPTTVGRLAMCSIDCSFWNTLWNPLNP